MRRYALEIVHVPDGLGVVTPDGSRVVRCEAGASFDVGLSHGSAVSIRGNAAALESLYEGGWGGRRVLWFHVDHDGSWSVEQVGAGRLVRSNGAPDAAVDFLRPGDLLEPSRGLVFALIDLEALSPPMGEPPEMLDAIAEAPWDDARWYVLADWLIEHQAPHALLAAYELKLAQGTNDPDVIGEYSAIRRVRHRLNTDLRVDQLVWKCGYLVSCGIWLGPHESRETERLTRAFRAPQFAALSRLSLQLTGAESRERLEDVLAVVPSTVRTVGLQVAAAVPSATLAAVRARPARATTLRLHLTEPVGDLARLVDQIVGAGWRTIDFEGTRLAERSAELAPLAEQHPGTTFLLGGTAVGGHDARRLTLPNVWWASAQHEAMLVDVQTGAALPLSQQRQGLAWGLPLAPFAQGWTVPDRDRLLASGDTITGSIGRRYLYLSGPNLNAVYRDWLDTWAGGDPYGRADAVRG